MIVLSLFNFHRRAAIVCGSNKIRQLLEFADVLSSLTSCCLHENTGLVTSTVGKPQRCFRFSSSNQSQRNASSGRVTEKSSMPEDSPKKLAFLSQANPVTGKMEWVALDRDEYDYTQEIARSGYGDMLHDVDRNEKYYAAIRQVIRQMKEAGKEVKVLDVGTGTGLLSMMAAASGADSVTACEAFEPMAKCAEKVLKANGFGQKVRLIPKRSTDFLLGEDMKERANLLVTELFDTELIGEGAIPSYTDVHDRLMQDDCVAVPSLGIMYVQAVQSPTLRQWNSLQEIQLPDGSAISIPPVFQKCSGAPSLHDLQVDEIQGEITLLSDPVEVFRFDFSKKRALKTCEDSVRSVQALVDGTVDAFVMWWDLDMEPTGSIVLSCAPCWTKAPGEPVPWRDHWMQAVYYPSLPLPVTEGCRFDVHSSHDEYSLWFDTHKPDSSRPVCTCGLHVTMSRNRLAQMNCSRRNHVFVSMLQKYAGPSKTCLVISDGSMLPLIAARLGFKKVFCLDNNLSTYKVIRQVAEHNSLLDKIVFLQGDAEKLSAQDFEGCQIDVVISEPYFQGVQLPWQHIYPWYAFSAVRPHLSPDAVVLPQSMTIKAVALQFRDLHKIRAPVGVCEGFDITHFDQLIQKSSDTVDEEVEPQPLWEYPSHGLSNVKVVMSLDLTSPVEDTKARQETVHLECSRPGRLNGVALWTEFKFGDDHILNCGLMEDEEVHDKLCWDKTSKQGVHLFTQDRAWHVSDRITVDAAFNPSNGDFTFQFT